MTTTNLTATAHDERPDWEKEAIALEADRQAERRQLIRRHLGVSRPYSPAVDAANDEIQALLAVVEDIAEPAELSRYYAELIGQLSMRIAQANGGK